MKYVEHADMKRTGPLAWLGALGLVVLMSLASGNARAEDEPSSLWSVDKKIIYEVLRSFGMTPKRTLEDQFEFPERAPLEVPSSRVPPPPQTTSAARVDANAGQAAKKPPVRRKDIDPDRFTDTLHPSELAATRAAPAAPSRPAGEPGMSDTVPPAQLGSSGGLFGGLFGGNNSRQPEQRQVDTSDAEPPPRRLIDPPAGYLSPAPGQPYGTAPVANAPRPTKPADHALGDNVGL
jgi:hypothetical protein